MHRTRTALVVAAAALVGPLAACSGSDDTGLGRPVADEAGEATAIAARRELAERHDDVAEVTIDGASDAFEVRSVGVIGMVGV